MTTEQLSALAEQFNSIHKSLVDDFVKTADKTDNDHRLMMALGVASKALAKKLVGE